MRPLQLELTYFGPYRHVLVDFTKFDSQPLFLISGKTGSGKTTLFDGMCYALFNQTTNAQRNASSLRSDFAPRDVESKLTLLFEHEGVQYQITRKPAQQLLGRGHKMVDHPAHVELIYPANSDQPKSITKIPDADRFIHNLLHLDRDQFRQIALLPQGKFRQFLSSSSNDKEKLLRSLFDTGLYARWSEVLKKQLSQRQHDQEQLQTRLDTLKQNEGEIAPDLSTEEWALAVTDKINQQKKQQKELTIKTAEQEKAEQKANDQFRAAQKLQEQQKELVQVSEQLHQLQAQAGEMQGVQTAIHKLAWFNVQQKNYYAYVDGQKRTLSLQSHRDKLQKELTKKQDQQDTVQTKLTALQRSADKVTALKNQLGVLKNQLTIYQQRDDLQRQLTADKKLLQGQRDKLQKNKEKLANLKQRWEDGQQQLTELSDVDNSRLALLEQRHHLMDSVNLWHRIKDQTKERGHKQEELKKVKEQLKLAGEQLQTSKQHYNELQDRRTRNQIAALVAKLHDGQACPVCGSLDHPHPAKVTHPQTVTDEELQAANDAYADAKTDQGKLQTQQKQLQTDLTDSRQQLMDLCDQLRTTLEMPEKSVDFSERLKAKQGQLNKQSDELQAQQKLQSRLKKQQEVDQEAQKALMHDCDQLQAAVQKTELVVAKTESALATQGQNLQYDDLATAQLQYQQMLRQTEDYDRQNQELSDQLSQAQQQVAAIKSQLKQTQLDQKKAEDQQKQQHNQLQEALAKADFAAEWSFWQWAQERLDQLGKLQQDLQDYRMQKSKVQDRFDQLKTEIGDQEAVDLKPLQEKAASVHQQIAALQEKSGSLKQSITQRQNNLEQVQQLISKQKQSFDQLSELTTLVGVVNGNTDSRLGLERYVLRSYFEEVLQAANPRLQELSNGRYLFALSDEVHGNGAKWAGLEINVYDDNAGRYRSAHTLSGGESFIASLALALALSDVVQQHQGGVHIDALFVDEGFGSLDADALQQALEALQSIPGDRMVGIISHVAALEEQIPNQLQVKTDHGISSVQYQLEDA